MTQVAMMVPPPSNWQDFEELMLSICEAIWPDGNVQRYGRHGQAQQGVDMYSWVPQKQGYIGLQCKKKNPTNALGNQEIGGQLTLNEVEAEVKKADSFDPVLKQFIIATTASTDSKVQAEIRELSSARSQTSKFSVDAWFWEDIQSRLDQHPHIMYRYYVEFMQSNSVYNADNHILSVLHMAFSRPAFNTYLDIENNSGDLLQAIRDTQSAINTGTLRDRENGDVLRSAPSGANSLSKPEWRTSLRSITKLLSQVRDDYTEAISNKAVTQHHNYTIVRDYELSARLNRMRGEAIRELNLVLAEAGLDKVESRLL